MPPKKSSPKKNIKKSPGKSVKKSPGKYVKKFPRLYNYIKSKYPHIKYIPINSLSTVYENILKDVLKHLEILIVPKKNFITNNLNDVLFGDNENYQILSGLLNILSNIILGSFMETDNEREMEYLEEYYLPEFVSVIQGELGIFKQLKQVEFYKSPVGRTGEYVYR